MKTRKPVDEAFWFQEGPGVRKWQFTTAGIKLLNVGNILPTGELDLSKTDRCLSREEAETRYKHFFVDEGDLVIASSGISFDDDGLLRTRGAFVRRSHLPLCLNTSTIRFKSKGDADLRYLRFWLDSHEFRSQITRLVTGSAQQNFGPSHLENIQISLPDPSEQQRIAARLEQADRLRRTRRYALELTDTFLPAVFLELFGDPVANPRGWERAKIYELGDVETGNTPPRERADYYGSAIEWIKSDNISLAQMRPSKATEGLSEKGIEVGRIVETGSLLLTCIAGSETSIGNAVLTDRRVAFNQQINAVTPHRDVDPQFLYGLFFTAKPMIQRNTTLAMKRMITKGKLEELVLIKPPLALQQKFAAVVERVERLRAVQREALRQAEHLFASLLLRAFSG